MNLELTEKEASTEFNGFVSFWNNTPAFDIKMLRLKVLRGEWPRHKRELLQIGNSTSKVSIAKYRTFLAQHMEKTSCVKIALSSTCSNEF